MGPMTLAPVLSACVGAQPRQPHAAHTHACLRHMRVQGCMYTEGDLGMGRGRLEQRTAGLAELHAGGGRGRRALGGRAVVARGAARVWQRQVGVQREQVR